MLNVTKGDLCVGVHLKRCLYVSSPAEIVRYFYFMSWSPNSLFDHIVLLRSIVWLFILRLAKMGLR